MNAYNLGVVFVLMTYAYAPVNVKPHPPLTGATVFLPLHYKFTVMYYYIMTGAHQNLWAPDHDHNCPII